MITDKTQMTKNITLTDGFVVMPEYSEVCIESNGGYRVHLTIDEWEHLIEVWQEYRRSAYGIWQTFCSRTRKMT